MRYYTEKPNIRLACLPVGLSPGTTISKLCVGFQPLLSNPLFDTLIDPLHELRCLTIAFHFSGCTANIEMPTFTQLCTSLKTKHQKLLKTFGSNTFDLCLLGMMLFLDFILLCDHRDIVFLSTLLRTTFESMREADFAEMDNTRMLWLLYIGFATAQCSTNLTSWYREQLLNILSVLHVLGVKDAKNILVEFLWVDGICDDYLAEICKVCGSRRSGFVIDEV
jgi:hypothetical protein